MAAPAIRRADSPRWPPRIDAPHARDEIDTAYGTLERRLAEHRTAVPAAHAAELARGEEEVGPWLAAVRERAMVGGFRDGTTARADLLAVVEDPTAAPTARAGAALALRTGLAPEERARIRLAASASAAPSVRVALEAVADDAVTEERAAKAVFGVTR